MPHTLGPSCGKVLPGSLQDLEVLIWIIGPELMHHSGHKILFLCKILQTPQSCDFAVTGSATYPYCLMLLLQMLQIRKEHAAKQQSLNYSSKASW